MREFNNIPVGVQDFPSIIEGGYIYVDKTQFIPSLERLSRAHFLSRPRRFGKSLFVSMLQAYFEGRSELFKGLFIERYKREKGESWESYPVLKLDLSAKKYSEAEQLQSILKDHIAEWQNKHNIQVDSKEPDSAFENIIRQLYEKEKKRVVILIDEYDSPLLAALDNEKLSAEYRATLKAFYGVIKKMNGYIHLSFLTGVTKFSKVSIFSGLNNLSDISYRNEYASICGITQEELESYFAGNIEEMAQLERLTKDEMIAVLKKKYDGYHFSESMVNVYNPFSICNAFDAKNLGDYWFESGTPSFLVHLFEQRSFTIPDLEGNINTRLDEMDDYRIDNRNLVPLLFQAGYLTIKAYDKRYRTYTLGLPNDEVRFAFARRLMNIYTGASVGLAREFAINEFVDSIEAGDIERVLILIKSLLASIPYDSYPPDFAHLREHNYQTAIYLIFQLMGQYVRAEVHSATGRSDVEVETPDAIYVFEFKVGGKPSDAIAQIKDAGYAERWQASTKKVVLIGAVISKNKRTLSKWKIETA